MGGVMVKDYSSARKILKIILIVILVILLTPILLTLLLIAYILIDFSIRPYALLQETENIKSIEIVELGEYSEEGWNHENVVVCIDDHASLCR